MATDRLPEEREGHQLERRDGDDGGGPVREEADGGAEAAGREGVHEGVHGEDAGKEHDLRPARDLPVRSRDRS